MILLSKSMLNGDGEIRTLDPLLARQVLSQLSYAPRFPVFLFLVFFRGFPREWA